MRSTELSNRGELVIRPATEDDSSAVAEVYVASRRAAPMPDAVELADADETWVAESEGAVVGFARVTGDWLDDLYVAPPYAGQGVGTALLDLVKSLRPGGFCLWVFETNQPARDFYGRRGCVELEVTDGSGNQEGEPDVRVAWPGEQPLMFLRGLVDDLDADLAVVLERRAALTQTIQTFKPVGGPAGRDPERERQIAEQMAERAPRLGAERLQRIIHAVITESLDAV